MIPNHRVLLLFLVLTFSAPAITVADDGPPPLECPGGKATCSATCAGCCATPTPGICQVPSCELKPDGSCRSSCKIVKCPRGGGPRWDQLLPALVEILRPVIGEQS